MQARADFVTLPLLLTREITCRHKVASKLSKTISGRIILSVTFHHLLLESRFTARWHCSGADNLTRC